MDLCGSRKQLGGRHSYIPKTERYLPIDRLASQHLNYLGTATASASSSSTTENEDETGGDKIRCLSSGARSPESSLLNRLLLLQQQLLLLVLLGGSLSHLFMFSSAIIPIGRCSSWVGGSMAPPAQCLFLRGMALRGSCVADMKHLLLALSVGIFP